MLDVTSQLILPLLGALGGGVAAYVAIRSDLAALKAQMTFIEAMSQRAHERIDSILKNT